MIFVVRCIGPGPHAPADGILGHSETEPGPALCAPCGMLVQSVADQPPPDDPVTLSSETVATVREQVAVAESATTDAERITALVAAVAALSRDLGQQET